MYLPQTQSEYIVTSNNKCKLEVFNKYTLELVNSVVAHKKWITNVIYIP